MRPLFTFNTLASWAAWESIRGRSRGPCELSEPLLRQRDGRKSAIAEEARELHEPATKSLLHGHEHDLDRLG
jgi:hypothetical protein